MQVHVGQLRVRLAGKVAQGAADLVHPVGEAEDAGDVLARLGRAAALQIGQGIGREVADGAKRLVQLVRQCRGHLPKRGKLGRLHEVPLRPAQLGLGRAAFGHLGLEAGVEGGQLVRALRHAALQLALRFLLHLQSFAQPGTALCHCSETRGT